MRALILISKNTYRIKEFIDATRKLNLEVLIGTDQDNLLEFSKNSFTIGNGVKKILEINKEKKIDIITAVDDSLSLVAAKAAEKLKLPYNSLEAVKTAKNKYLFRQKLKNIWFKRVNVKNNPSEIEVKFPCVLKPIFLAASQGVIKANNRREFVKAFNRIKRLLEDEEEGADYILIEEYIPGKEVALEGILVNGKLKVLALFDKPDPLEGPYFEETIYVTPSRLNGEIQNKIFRKAEEATRILGLKQGPIHAELRINEGRIFILEIAARSIGGLCSRVLRFLEDKSLEELILMQASGASIEKYKLKDKAIGVMMIPIHKKGILKEVRGKENARKIKHVEDINITIAKNQKVIPLPEGNRYLGFIFARAEKVEDVEKALRKAHKKLEFVIE